MANKSTNNSGKTKTTVSAHKRSAPNSESTRKTVKVREYEQRR